MEIPEPPLLLITDRKLAGERLLEIVEECFQAGCRWLMIREKDLSAEELENFIKPYVKLSEKYCAKLFLNSNPELVVKYDLHGVHLPWGFPIRKARELVGKERIVGVSTHSIQEAIKAESEGADYITLSPIFKSISKKDYEIALGTEMLRRIAGSVRIPTIALGGITAENVQECMRNGARGVAAIGAILLSKEPGQTVKLMLEKIRSNAG